MTAKTMKDRAETHNGGEETHKGRRWRRRAETHKGRQRRNPQGAATMKASRDPQRAVEKKPRAAKGWDSDSNIHNFGRCNNKKETFLNLKIPTLLSKLPITHFRNQKPYSSQADNQSNRNWETIDSSSKWLEKLEIEIWAPKQDLFMWRKKTQLRLPVNLKTQKVISKSEKKLSRSEAQFLRNPNSECERISVFSISEAWVSSPPPLVGFFSATRCGSLLDFIVAAPCGFLLRRPLWVSTRLRCRRPLWVSSPPLWVSTLSFVVFAVMISAEMKEKTEMRSQRDRGKKKVNGSRIKQ
jgi:hypothetical protein